MEQNNNCELANLMFLDFINEGLQNNNDAGIDEEMIDQTGNVLSSFSLFTVSLVNNEKDKFLKLYEFAIALYDFDVSESDQSIIALKVIDLLKEHCPGFFNNYEKEILLLFYEIIKSPVLSVKILKLLSRFDESLLPYPDYITIQIKEQERVLKLIEAEDMEEVLQSIKKLKLQKFAS